MENEVLLYGIALLSSIPMRKEPAEQSEMVTQLLFGDTFKILEKKESWVHIRNDYDTYEGWISKNMVEYLEKSAYEECQNAQQIVSSLTATVCEEGKMPIQIVRGSVLPNYKKENKICKIASKVLHFEGEIAENTQDIREEIAFYAKGYLNAPYLWGGKSPYGIDCSGFTQQVARLVRITLPRDASQQIEKGTEIGFLAEAKVGDLAFFDNEEGRITHTGILLGNDTIIHSSGKVRIDRIDQQGIFNQELQKYTHRLRVLKNIVG